HAFQALHPKGAGGSPCDDCRVRRWQPFQTRPCPRQLLLPACEKEGRKRPTSARERRGWQVPHRLCSKVARENSPTNAYLMCIVQLAHTLISLTFQRKEKRTQNYDKSIVDWHLSAQGIIRHASTNLNRCNLWQRRQLF